MVRSILEKEAIWEYFVFPSINWDAKGPRVAALIEAIQLRPETVMLIDDNPLNLHEASHFVPKLQTAGPEIIPEVLDDRRFVGKDDSSFTRLQQYKVLEKRQSDQILAIDNIDFLRSSGIKIYLEHDIEAHIDRVVELISRTNQLNFTKKRLSEDAEAARAELRNQLEGSFVQAGLVRVTDKYGDYGFCGFYATHVNISGKYLDHYCFSCRTLGMGVEAYVYELLGRPQLAIVGDVLSNPIEEKVDWITIMDANEIERDTPMTLRSGIYLRGGCDLMVVEHYARMATPFVVGEYNIARDGQDIRLDHSLIARHAIAGVPSAAMRAFAELGYRPEDFSSEALSAPLAGVVVLSYSPDFWVPVYRHNETGTFIPFLFPIPGVWNPTTGIAPEERARRISNPHVFRAVEILEREFTYEHFIGERQFKENLHVIFGNIPSDSRGLVLLHKEYHGDDPEARAQFTVNINRWTEQVASCYGNVEPLPIMRFVEHPGEIVDGNHFSRAVYFRLANYIKTIARSVDEAKGPTSPPNPCAETGPQSRHAVPAAHATAVAR